jgi:hypothetical protein
LKLKLQFQKFEAEKEIEPYILHVIQPFKTLTTLIQTYAIGAEHVSFSKPFFSETNKLECFVPDLLLGLGVKLGGCSQNLDTLRLKLKKRNTDKQVLHFLFSCY